MRSRSSNPNARPDHHRRLDAGQPWRAWYKTARWQELKDRVHKRDRFICQRTGVLCLGKHPAPDSPVANHKVRHEGDPVLFWDETNVETVTKAVHDGLIQSEEKSGHLAIGLDGWPVDQRHPVYTGRIERRIGTRKSHPDWFRPVYVPLTIVCGAPGSGKSTYVAKHAGPHDLVVCSDRIASSIFPSLEGKRSHASLTVLQVGDVLRARNDLLGKLMWAEARTKWPAAWLIVSEPRPERRQWWQDRVNPASIVVLETSADVCKARVDADATAGDVRHATVHRTIDKWWAEYRPREGEAVVKP